MRAWARCLAPRALLLLSVGLLLYAVLRLGRELTPAHSLRPLVPDDSQGELTGRVFSGGAPVAGARVRVRGHPAFALSGSAGRFCLTRPEGNSLFVTAAREGYYVRGTEMSEQPLRIELEPLPTGDSEDYRWIDPAPDAADELRCAKCHQAIYGEWKSSGHARSAANRRFMNLYEGSDWQGEADRGWSLLADYPLGAGVCMPCHAPTVPLDHPAVDDMRLVEGVAAQGVHCDFCHKIQRAPTEFAGLNHGRFAFELLRPKQRQVFFGPLDDVATGEDSYSPLQKHSRICAPCHEGVVFGVHIYSTYSEWLASDARRRGRHCQSCHMQPTGEMTNVAPDAGGVERDPATLACHVTTPGGRAETLRKCLQVQAVLRRRSSRVQVEVTVAARDVGHRVPGGYVDRHLVLDLEALDQSGSSLSAEEGPLLPLSAGGLAGRSGRLFARLMTDNAGRSPVPFWRAADDPADTRLEPDQPVRVSFVFPPATARVRVRLIYRRFWDRVARDKKWPDNEIVVFDRTVRATQDESYTVESSSARAGQQVTGTDN